MRIAAVFILPVIKLTLFIKNFTTEAIRLDFIKPVHKAYIYGNKMIFTIVLIV